MRGIVPRFFLYVFCVFCGNFFRLMSRQDFWGEGPCLDVECGSLPAFECEEGRGRPRPQKAKRFACTARFFRDSWLSPIIYKNDESQNSG